MTMETLPDIVREKIKVDDDCWLWLACKDKGGYGQFRDNIKGKMVRAHRYICELLIGPLGDYDLVPTCGRKDCVNPIHKELALRNQGRNMGRPRGS